LGFHLQLLKLNHIMPGARRETRTLKDLTPTASETATFTNFAIRALNYKRFISVATNLTLFSRVYQAISGIFQKKSSIIYSMDQ
jgi:hypothetical protein